MKYYTECKIKTLRNVEAPSGEFRYYAYVQTRDLDVSDNGKAVAFWAETQFGTYGKTKAEAVAKLVKKLKLVEMP